MSPLVEAWMSENRPDTALTVAVGNVSVFADADETIIMLAGEVDLALADDLEDAGTAAIDRALPIRVDLYRVTFIDSTGVEFLDRLASLEQRRRRRLVIAGVSQMTRERLLLVGLVDLVDISGTLPTDVDFSR
jgi:anti-sigma B factor antagonist